MELEELQQRLTPFCRAKYADNAVAVSAIFKMPGHAGFAYGFSVQSKDSTDKWYLRLPPPNVKLQGTADVLRQVAALDAMPDQIPHCQVKWSGDDSQWFGRPYFIVPQLEGDVVRLDGAGWVTKLEQAARINMARQAIHALVAIHQVDWRQAAYLGAPVAFEEDVTRWDRFLEKAADPHCLKLVPTVRALLLKQLPEDTPVGIFHGDFQWSNLFYSPQGKLLAVIDWELVGVGAVLNDIGWYATFNDPQAWADPQNRGLYMPQADELIDMYLHAYGRNLPDINWYRALAAYKFSIITGFNLMLHRRGKRHDPMWETTRESMQPLLERAYSLLA
ncbi:MAG: phosphotransferase family protein [Pseudohongiella sp.]|nr:phosphotransferase family protein [Pseudohongiella sp.]